MESQEEFTIAPNSAVICRYNAPLLKMAFGLIEAGQNVDVAGLDIGTRIIKLLTKLGDDSISQAQTLAAIDQWEAEHNAAGSKSAADTGNCMRVFANQGKTLSQAIAYAKYIFSITNDGVKFMSGHRSKGLEFDHVYHLNRDKIRQGGQEQNIHYVIDTRPKQRLTYIQTK